MDGTYSEVLFIPYDKNFDMLSQGIQKMAFIDGNDMLYICLEDTIYRFDIIMKDVEVVLEQAESEDCAISGNGRSLVISHRDADGEVSEIEWRNLETGDTQVVRAADQRLEMVGLLGQNLVYGEGSCSGRRKAGCAVILSMRG